MAVFCLSYQKYDSGCLQGFFSSFWLMTADVDNFKKLFLFFNSSHIFGCYLEVLWSGRIASNNIWIPFSFLIPVSFSCILKESTYNDNLCFHRSYIGFHSVQKYHYLRTDSHFQSVWHQALLQQILFWGKKSRGAAPHFLLLSSSFCRVAGPPCLTFKLAYFPGNISKKPIHAKNPIILTRILYLDWKEVEIVSKDY